MRTQFTQRLAILAARIDALSLRERGILLVVALMVLYAISDRLLFAPALLQLQQRGTEITELQTKLGALQARAALFGENGHDPLAQRGARIAELEAVLDEQNRHFEAQLGRLVQPQQAAPLLRDILRQQPGLSLLALDTAPGAPLLGNSERGARIVRYDVDLRVEGGYLAALDYLRRLEQLPWSLFWDSFELHVQEHPKGDIRLAVYTLGQQR
jgi:MSHA biogenesis protein MshJ